MLNSEQIKSNWDKFLSNIDTHISSPRKEQLTDFYKSIEDRVVLMAASPKKSYHNCFAGGYVDHVNRVVECSLKLQKVWAEMGGLTNTFTTEELVFAAINHDLGKVGTKDEAFYIPNPSDWHVKNQGQVYTFNDKIPFMDVPSRSLFLLQEAGIKVSMNETIAIRTHDGLFDEGNKAYFINYQAEQKPRTNLPYILHHADMMASRIEFENEHTELLQPNAPKKKDAFAKLFDQVQK